MDPISIVLNVVSLTIGLIGIWVGYVRPREVNRALVETSEILQNLHQPAVPAGLLAELKTALAHAREHPKDLSLSRKALAFAQKAEAQADEKRIMHQRRVQEGTWTGMADGDRTDSIQELAAAFKNETGLDWDAHVNTVTYLPPGRGNRTLVTGTGVVLRDFFLRRGWKAMQPAEVNNRGAWDVIKWARAVIKARAVGSHDAFAVGTDGSGWYQHIDYFGGEGKKVRLSLTAVLEGYEAYPAAKCFEGDTADVERWSRKWVESSR